MLLYLIVKRWVSDFKKGRASTNVEPRPVVMITPQIIKKLHTIMLEICRLKLTKIAETVRLSKKLVGNVLHKILHIKKQDGWCGC